MNEPAQMANLQHFWRLVHECSNSSGRDDGAGLLTGMPATTTVQTDQFVDRNANYVNRASYLARGNHRSASTASDPFFRKFSEATFFQLYDRLKLSPIGETATEERRG
jgi:hypothetical protein